MRYFYFILKKKNNYKKIMKKTYVPFWILNSNINFCKINFANKIIDQILDPYLISIYDEKLNNFLKKRNGNGFPGSLAVSILRENFDLIKNNSYSFLMKSDGIRYMLFIFQYYDKNNNYYIIDLINRSFTHYIIKCKFSENIFNGTLFDGELVKTKNGLYEYQIFDCIVYSGKYIGDEKHSKRLEIASNCIKNEYIFEEYLDTFKIIVKDYVSPKEALENFYSDLYYPIDGWILQDMNKPFLSGKDLSLFKYKKLGNFIFLYLC